MAAWVARSTQAMIRYGEAVLNCFVDEPILAMSGKETEGRHIAKVVILWCCVLSCIPSFSKGQFGIGAKVLADVVRVCCSQSKFRRCPLRFLERSVARVSARCQAAA